MSSRRCINPKDTFCYVCGLFTDKRHRKSITSQLKKAYEFYFDSKVDIGKSWAPSIFLFNMCKYALLVATQVNNA